MSEDFRFRGRCPGWRGATSSTLQELLVNCLEHSPEALLPRLLRELLERGRGDIPTGYALMTLEGVKKEMR